MDPLPQRHLENKSQTNYNNEWSINLARNWTPESRAQQKKAIRRWKPWEKSTGPISAGGKATSCQNAVKHGMHSEMAKQLKALLVQHSKALQEIIIMEDSTCTLPEQFDPAKVDNVLFNLPRP